MGFIDDFCGSGALRGPGHLLMGDTFVTPDPTSTQEQEIMHFSPLLMGDTFVTSIVMSNGIGHLNFSPLLMGDTFVTARSDSHSSRGAKISVPFSWGIPS